MLKMKNKGQTLIEVIVAIAVMGVVLTSMVLVATIGIKSARLAKERSEARHLVGNRLEQARRDRDGDPETCFGAGTRTDVPENVGSGPVYTVTTSYVEIVVGAQYEVTIEAVWIDGLNNYSVTQSTYLSKWQ